MKKILMSVCAASLLFAAPAAAQFTVTAPTGATPINVRAADDFATRAFQDPWDMSQRTDVGWWTFGTDTSIALNFQNPTVTGGVFTGTNPGGTAGLYLLESPLAPTNPGGTPTPIGKTGQQYPIEASFFTHLVYRMRSTHAGVSQYAWSTTNIYTDQTLAVEMMPSATRVATGWKIYEVNLAALTVLHASQPWATTGTKRSLQLIANATPTASTAQIQIDWARLVHDEPALHQNVTWTGTAAADIYLDTDTNAANGTLGRIAVNRTSPYNFFVGALPAGRYFVALHAVTTDEATTGFTYSTGSYQVNEIPTLQFTTPSAEGSSEDFATTRLGNPWDFNAASDVDRTEHVVSSAFTPLALTSEAGVSLGSPIVYFATSASANESAAGGVGDAQVFPLFWDSRGKVTRIDPARYRILTVEAGIPDRARSLPSGSIGRIVWRAAHEPVRDPNNVGIQTVGEHFALNSKAGENTLARVTIDMKDYPLEPGSVAKSEWLSSTALSGGIDSIRFDPHEFHFFQKDVRVPFFMKRMKLAALERTVGNLLTIRWTYSKPSGTVSLFLQPAGTARNFATGAVQIATNVSATSGSFTWDATAVADGEYQIYAIFGDGTNSNRVYAPTNVVVDHANIAVKQIALNRTKLNFAILGPFRTSAQTIRLTFTGTGDECWTSSSNAGSLISVSPATGNGATNISIMPAAGANFPGGTTDALITISSCTNPSNSRAIAVSVTSLNSSTAPAGAIDTPAPGAVVTGSVAVTGWATDDLEVTSVRICRDPIPATETTTPGACAGQNRVFIGNGVFIDDARSDIETANPTRPLNYRAGWGYLLLTNFLPNQGNGAVTLYAYATDREGNTALLGSRTISAQNATATKPFGAIDTPGQGQVVCGVIANAGWVLTQNGKDIPANSSTISVFIDNVFVGRPGTRIARSDITSLFPTYDTSHAAGGYIFDTRAYANGVHSIFWIVEDTGGQRAGVGSRFFTISNPCAGS